MRIIDDIPVWGEAEPGALEQIKRCAKWADHVALMADNHLGYSVPIGGVLAATDAISPNGVGFDIGCGNMAVRLDMTEAELCAAFAKSDPGRSGVAAAMDLIVRHISFGLGRVNDVRIDHALFDDPAWQYPAVRQLRDRAAKQLGTVGSGNHYVDLLADLQGRVWVGVHFGSRGFGHGIATHYLAAAGSRDGMHVDPVFLPAEGELGGEYLEAMRLAGEYAAAGREWVCWRVAALLRAPVMEEVHNHHNYAWRERHVLNGVETDLWVVRKGATPAFPGQRGFVGGSMGDVSVILEGVEHEHADQALRSTIHGAGRVMGRKRAAGLVKRRWVMSAAAVEELEDLRGKARNLPRGSQERRKLGLRIAEIQTKGAAGYGSWDATVIRPPEISETAMREWLARQRVVLRGGGLDEAPQCYRRLPDVLAAHEGTVRVLHYLRPLGVAMAGPDITDPYKD